MAPRKPKTPAAPAEVTVEETKTPAAPAAVSHAAKKGDEFTVFDSNGKPFRVVKDREEADRLANTIGGKFK